MMSQLDKCAKRFNVACFVASPHGFLSLTAWAEALSHKTYMIYMVHCLRGLKLGFHRVAAYRDSKDISHLIESQNAPAFRSSPRSPMQKKKSNYKIFLSTEGIKTKRRAAPLTWTPVAGC